MMTTLCLCNRCGDEAEIFSFINLIDEDGTGYDVIVKGIGQKDYCIKCLKEIVSKGKAVR